MQNLFVSLIEFFPVFFYDFNEFSETAVHISEWNIYGYSGKILSVSQVLWIFQLTIRECCFFAISVKSSFSTNLLVHYQHIYNNFFYEYLTKLCTVSHWIQWIHWNCKRKYKKLECLGLSSFGHEKCTRHGSEILSSLFDSYFYLHKILHSYLTTYHECKVHWIDFIFFGGITTCYLKCSSKFIILKLHSHCVFFFLIATAFLKCVTWESTEMFTPCVFLRWMYMIVFPQSEKIIVWTSLKPPELKSTGLILQFESRKLI